MDSLKLNRVHFIIGKIGKFLIESERFNEKASFWILSKKMKKESDTEAFFHSTNLIKIAHCDVNDISWLTTYFDNFPIFVSLANETDKFFLFLFEIKLEPRESNRKSSYISVFLERCSFRLEKKLFLRLN